jgi:hypothetical protein
MRLTDCAIPSNLQPRQFVVSAPLQRDEPEKDWTRAHSSGAIPAELYDLYRRADYLSFGRAPKFLRDNDNVLFSYFAMLLQSVMESLQDADEQLQSFIENQKLAYDYGKKIRGEHWDPEADAKARRNFRDLLIALQSSLDALADLVALFFTGLVPDLRLGRAQFSRIEKWLKRPLPPFGIVVTPHAHHLRELFDALEPLVNATGPEREWLPLMRLLRNKAAHLGQPVFRTVGLHDNTPKFFIFIPRQWPYIWERHIKPSGSSSLLDPNFLVKFYQQTLMHQDMVNYAKGLKAKVNDVVRAGISILANTYLHVQDFEPNLTALAELQGSSEAYAFEHFLND